jgi:hypothetical protein
VTAEKIVSIKIKPPQHNVSHESPVVDAFISKK